MSSHFKTANKAVFVTNLTQTVPLRYLNIIVEYPYEILFKEDDYQLVTVMKAGHERPHSVCVGGGGCKPCRRVCGSPVCLEDLLFQQGRNQSCAFAVRESQRKEIP